MKTMLLTTLLLCLLFVFIISWVFWIATRPRKDILKKTSKREATQFEIDLRLTYKRFKELYPYSTITYAEYKALQAKNAYKKALSSQKIKRMVR